MQQAQRDSQTTPPVPAAPSLDETARIAESLAERLHNAWMHERLEQGWKAGPRLDREKKEHPLLVPFTSLPEAEKHFNRRTAAEAIGTLLDLGYSKDRPHAPDWTTLLPDEEQAAKLIASLKKHTLSVAELRRLWVERKTSIWACNVSIYRRAVDACLRLGEAFLGFDIASEGLAVFERDLRLLQLQALALARTGATRRANQILEELRSHGHQDEETLGLLARTHKDFWILASDPDQRAKHLAHSLELYKEAYRLNRGYYSGINAASLALVSGNREAAFQLARDVARMCEETLAREPESTERYWLLSTLAESDLILGNLDSAATHYQSACDESGQGWSVINRTRSQARLLLEYTGHSTRSLDHCFSLPTIMVCSGHMFDRSGRQAPRFPVGLEDRVRREVELRLAEHNAQIGFSSLACGADTIFAEAILRRGGEVNIVLPFVVEDFKKRSVEIVPGLDLGRRFDKVFENAANITILNERGTAEDGAVYEYCNQAVIGLALLKGQFLGVDVVPLVIWDGQTGGGRGGTKSFVDLCWERGDKVELIQLDQLLAEEMPAVVGELPATADETITRSKKDTGFAAVSAQEIKAMLFADIVGFTKLNETQIPCFAAEFLGKVATLMNSMPRQPVSRNTWGDAIYCVFDDVSAAADFALALRALVRDSDWTHYGLPNDLSIRIALHAGPAYPCQDPVVGRLTFLGSHVNRTARIEPIAEEGQIYASQAFAALAAAQGVKDFVCDYVGQKQLAKSYGAFPVFLVRAAKNI